MLKINNILYYLILLFCFQACEKVPIEDVPEPNVELPGSVEIPPVDEYTPPGIVISHMPKSEQIYLGSPSICLLPNGDYVASYDWYGPKGGSGKSGKTFIFRSKDKGASWVRICTIDGQFWSNLFYHQDNLYIFGNDKGMGNIVIRRSGDKGVTWTNPIHKKKGLLFSGMYHTAPTPVVVHNGRIWRAFENANPLLPNNFKRYGALMLSAPVNSDLLDADNWLMSDYIGYNSSYLNNKFQGWIEGNALVSKEGSVVNLLRVHVYSGVTEYVGMIRIASNGYDLFFDPSNDFVEMPGASKKFTARYDKETDRYWSLVNYVPVELFGEAPSKIRNYLAVVSSDDLKKWITHRIVLYHSDFEYHAFQYVDWVFDNEDIIFVSRTAYDDRDGGADDYHNANYITFHRIIKYAELLKEKIE